MQIPIFFNTENIIVIKNSTSYKHSILERGYRMRKFISLSILIMSIFGLLYHDAQAKRFGGGKSFGVQRSMQQYSRPMSSLSSAASTPFSSAKKWLAPLAGLALGGLLASLFMGHGLGSGILAWLAVGSIIFLLFNLIKRKNATCYF